ncbi:MAG: nickel-responsive transcriptional regulator NikR [Polyangiaceae bacterium]|jgi:CopG family nickel-responsive transcriptional regulator|nr:nickel-responsive transcriptional regulator NikR [Polyangiaceae bacterium]
MGRPKKTEEPALARFGVAMERELLDRYDRHIASRGYENRSEAIRDLVRAELADAAWQGGDLVAASITVVYDHHVPDLTEHLIAVQHAHGAHVVSTLHVHLDHHTCLEVIVAKGPATTLATMVDAIGRTRGVLMAKVTAAGALREHGH